MCDPVTAALVAGSAVQAMGTITAGVGAFREGQFQQQVGRNNAQLAMFQADDAIRRGNLAEAESRRLTKRTKGTQKASFAASNVVLGEGSALDILQATAEAGELDALTIRNNAEREATAFEFQAQGALAQGALAAARGKNARTASFFKAGSSVLSTAAQTPAFGGA